jgi:hypothetical protein
MLLDQETLSILNQKGIVTPLEGLLPLGTQDIQGIEPLPLLYLQNIPEIGGQPINIDGINNNDATKAKTPPRRRDERVLGVTHSEGSGTVGEGDQTDIRDGD